MNAAHSILDPLPDEVELKLPFFQRFVSRCPTRPQFHQPWCDGARCYVTNGSTLLWAPRINSALMPEEFERLFGLPIPKVSNVLATHAKVLGWIPYKPDSQIIPCAECGGTGTTTSTQCHVCYGVGDIDSDDDYIQCPYCEGTGTGDTIVTPCINCAGKGNLPAPLRTYMGYFGPDVRKLIDDIPNLEYGLYESNGQLPIPIRFQGARGAVMPFDYYNEMTFIPLANKIACCFWRVRTFSTRFKARVQCS